MFGVNQSLNWQAYGDFWYFVNERHRIYLRQQQVQPKPWSDDPIFQQWKFCNVFRQLDKQSKWLIDNVIAKHLDAKPGLLLFNIFVFRAFNLSDTYEVLGWQPFWDEEAANDLLGFHVGLDKQLTSGAYMIRGRQGIPKYRSITRSLSEIWQFKENLAELILEEPYLHHAWRSMCDARYWGWGPFTCYQIALDLTYSPFFITPPVDINDWCYFGPGATRGLRQIWSDIPLKDEWMLQGAKHLLADQVKYREPHVPELNLQDIEFCLCELGKYRKIKAGGRGSERYAGR